MVSAGLRCEMAQLEQRLEERQAENAEMAQRLEQREAAMGAENNALREELAQYRGAQPEAGIHGAEPQPASADTIELVIQMVDGTDAPPDYQAGTLCNAAMDGHLATVQRWLGAGVDPNATHELLAGWTPLHYAAQLGHVAIIGSLLDHGASAQPFDRFDQSPLMQAGYWGYTEAEALLMGQGGGETRPTLVINSDDARVGRWDQEGYVTILCSAPEFSLSGDTVMVALFALCDMHRSR